MTKERFIIGVDVGKDTIAVTVKEKGKGKRASVNPMQIDRDNIAEKIEIDTRHCEPPVASDSVAIWGEAISLSSPSLRAKRSNLAFFSFNKVEIASHPSDARNDSKKYLIFKWLYQLLDFYRNFWDIG
ncbi:hypothetical protein [Thermodesulfovibrio hydrogeniphilus]